jgi:hypothetical protein
MLGLGRRKVIPRSQELVFLDADDDLSTIRSKLEASTAEEIYLVIPNRSPILKTPLEFRMLARIANEVSSETVLVSGDSNRRRLANQEGFRTRQSLRTLRHLMVEPGKRLPFFVLPDWIPGLGSLFTTILPLLVIVLAVALVLPQTKVTVVPQTTPIERDIDILVDPGVQQPDPVKGILPGQVLNQQFQVSGSLPIPADRTVGQDRARGEVIITSQRPDETTLTRGTRVAVDGGPKFTIDQDTRILPRVPTRVGITAVDPGTAGNVPPNAITVFDGVNLDNLTVVNQRPTTGGTDRNARIINADDQAALRDQLNKRAQDQGFFELKSRAGQDRSLPEQSFKLRVDNEAFDQAVGTEADQLTGRLTVTATATAFQNEAFNALVEQMLLNGAGAGTRLDGKATILPPGVLTAEAQKVSLRTHASGVAVSAVDADKIKTDLRFKSLAEAQRYVASLRGFAQPPKVEISPAWAPRALRVDVDVQGPK